MADAKKAPTAEMKKLEINKDATTGSDASKPRSPTSPTTPVTPTSPTGGGISRNPSAIKETILNWCKASCEGYEHVNITNFSSSWSDGMAFCALIHHYYPNAFDYSKLNPKNRRGNFKLAFDVAEKLGDIAPLLEVEDMVRMKNNPDWKCVFTYVQSMYRRLAIKQQQQQLQQQQSHEAKKDESAEPKTETKDDDAKDSKTNEKPSEDAKSE